MKNSNNRKLKIIAMIPARLNSKRVKKKNLRLIKNKPLVSYTIEIVKKCKLFDEIYLNSESEIFQNIAKKHNIDFYLRNKKFSKDTSTNDEFALDFITNIKGDILIQILPTSPLISLNEINSFVNSMINKKYDTLVSVEEKQIACVYKNKEINFNKKKKNPPSQTMEPIKVYSTVLMGWTYNQFINNMKILGSAYHGGKGKTGYFPLEGLSTLDIDNEVDFRIVEKIIESGNYRKKTKIRYYS